MALWGAYIKSLAECATLLWLCRPEVIKDGSLLIEREPEDAGHHLWVPPTRPIFL